MKTSTLVPLGGHTAQRAKSLAMLVQAGRLVQSMWFFQVGSAEPTVNAFSQENKQLMTLIV